MEQSRCSLKVLCSTAVPPTTPAIPAPMGSINVTPAFMQCSKDGEDQRPTKRETNCCFMVFKNERNLLSSSKTRKSAYTLPVRTTSQRSRFIQTKETRDRCRFIFVSFICGFLQRSHSIQALSWLMLDFFGYAVVEGIGSRVKSF